MSYIVLRNGYVDLKQVLSLNEESTLRCIPEYFHRNLCIAKDIAFNLYKDLLVECNCVKKNTNFGLKRSSSTANPGRYYFGGCRACNNFKWLDSYLDEDLIRQTNNILEESNISMVSNENTENGSPISGNNSVENIPEDLPNRSANTASLSKDYWSKWSSSISSPISNRLSILPTANSGSPKTVLEILSSPTYKALEIEYQNLYSRYDNIVKSNKDLVATNTQLLAEIALKSEI